MKNLRRFSTALATSLGLAALTVTALPAQVSAGTPDHVIRLEVLDGGATPKGTHMAGLRLTLAPGWKTYWRSPGEAGIPPQFDWRGSRNLKTVAITWPAPHAFEQSGLRTIGYKDGVVLPIELTPDRPGDAIRLKGSIDLGVCKDVCIPEELHFDVQLDPAAPRNTAILAAMAARPYSASEAGVSGVSCALKPTKDGLQITARIAMPSAGGHEVAVIESGNPLIWATETQASRSGNTLTATTELIHSEGGTIALDRSKVRMTVLGASHAVDIIGCDPG